MSPSPWCIKVPETASNSVTSCEVPEVMELFPLLSFSLQGRPQMMPKKEPTVTSAVGALLQNRALEASVVPTRPGELEGASQLSNDGVRGDHCWLWDLLAVSKSYDIQSCFGI